MSIEVMKQALAKFESLWEIGIDAVYKVELLPEIKALRQAIEQAEQIEPDLPPVEIGVDVTEHGTTVMAFYRRPNAVMEMFYSQFHPQPKQPKNPSIRIQNHSHTDHPMQHWDRTCPACVEQAEKQEDDGFIAFKTKTFQCLRLDKQGFHYNGQVIEDAGEAYRVFNEWLSIALLELQEKNT
jgi:hypothetical protein